MGSLELAKMADFVRPTGCPRSTQRSPHWRSNSTLVGPARLTGPPAGGCSPRSGWRRPERSRTGTVLTECLLKEQYGVSTERVRQPDSDPNYGIPVTRPPHRRARTVKPKRAAAQTPLGRVMR